MSSIPFSKPSLHTKRFIDISEHDFDGFDRIIVAKNPSESRGGIPVLGELNKKTPSLFVHIEPSGRDFVLIYENGKVHQKISLRDDASLKKIIVSKNLLIDISGMPHQVWASLLRVAYKDKIRTKVLYVEPKEYKLHSSPASSSLFDLTSSFEGLAPLPGFARLSTPTDEAKTILVILLGFEGNRSSRLAMQFDTVPRIIPIVGVPGFQISYPEHTIACNRDILKQNNTYSEIRYARASCPFDAYNTLADIHKDFPDHYLYLAPVGTKPHSLGAIWYAIENLKTTEVLFDFPVRKTNRTKGVGLIHMYNFGGFHGE